MARANNKVTVIDFILFYKILDSNVYYLYEGYVIFIDQLHTQIWEYVYKL